MRGSGSKRRVTVVELAIALILFGFVIAAESRSSPAASIASMVLRAVGVALFGLFAVWFSRAVWLSVRQAPDYALFGYSMLALCLVSWGLAFLYPFPLRSWHDAILRDLAFHAGFIAPLVALLAFAAVKLACSPSARERLSLMPAHSLRQRVGRVLALAMFIGFPVWFGARAANDIQDLEVQPLMRVDTVVSYFRGIRSGDSSVTWASVGRLRLPHGLWFRELHRGQRFQLLYTPHGRLLVGLRPEPSGP